MQHVISTAIYIIIGAGIGAFFYYVLKKHALGEIWGAAIVGTIGAVLGGKLFDKIYDLLKNIGNVNIGTSLIGAIILVWLFILVSPGTHKDKRQ
jgi:uncharacterized membrane protein YeaQ/YmgE (transglycosylase-associated protein family)